MANRSTRSGLAIKGVAKKTRSAAAAAGLGVILVPSWLIECDLAEGRLKEVLPNYRVVPDAMPIYAVYPQQRHLAPKVRAFIDFLVERFRENPSRPGA